MRYKDTLDRTTSILKRITAHVCLQTFNFKVSIDDKDENGRVYIQTVYRTPCTKTGYVEEWKGRKWTISEHMTDDEIVKTAYAAFEMAVKHEVLEGFKVDGKTLFNPHVDFEELLKISSKEIQRS